jgi:hypothetical protein
MLSALEQDWTKTNQDYLWRALAQLKRMLRRHADGGGAMIGRPPAPGGRQCPEPSLAEVGCPPVLAAIAGAFSLSSFERDILLLCAGVELDRELAQLCGAAQGDGSCIHPTFGLALAALPEPHWSALAPGAALRRWRLIEPVIGPTLTAAPLRIDERVMHHLVGISHLDERLASLVRPLPPTRPDDLVPSHAAVAARIAASWAAAASSSHAAVVQLCGDPADCRPIAACVAGSVGLHAAAVEADLVPASVNELEAFMRLIEREARLTGIGVLLLETDSGDCAASGAEPRPQGYTVTRLAELLDGFVMLCESERRRIPRRDSVAFDVRRPLLREQQAVWRTTLAGIPCASDLIAAIDAVCAQFNLSVPSIRAIAAEAVATAPLDADQTVASLWELCRARLRVRLDALAQRIQSASTWDDLVLPENETAILRVIAAQLRRRVTVYDHWGFADKSARGLGISALFAGPSGTGKTMAAEVLANELHLDVYRIDLSSVVSKYIGETEKNLRRVFDAAEESGAILLFDEADALFGKRSEVKDSHDRYANIEVSYLLQRMEAYRGLAILTTNQRSALDPAFLRRLRFVVQFPFPDAPQRAAIWQRVFPPATPTEGLDHAKLARLRVPGGNIRNIALNAAFLAADMAEPVRMSHLLAAARSEYAKLERPLTAAESEGWV